MLFCLTFVYAFTTHKVCRYWCSCSVSLLISERVGINNYICNFWCIKDKFSIVFVSSVTSPCWNHPTIVQTPLLFTYVSMFLTEIQIFCYSFNCSDSVNWANYKIFLKIILLYAMIKNSWQNNFQMFQLCVDNQLGHPFVE